MSERKCRFCDSKLNQTFCDLGTSPLSNAFLKEEDLAKEEAFFPLHAYVCENCFLVQLEEFEKPENIFSDYAYFSSFSESWLKHAKEYTEKMTDRFGYGSESQVIEIASNDGYLLRNFVEKGIKALGIEPAENVAEAAVEKGVPTLVKFFGVNTAKELADSGTQADLLIGNNVLAHVPNINDFVAGMKIILKADGVITMEFPHLLRLMDENQFDTIYHEHFSYLSFLTTERIFAKHGLELFDVEEIPTHGGSLRIYAKHKEDASKQITPAVIALREREKEAGLENIETYKNFQIKVTRVKEELIRFLQSAREAGKKVIGYGAPAKGNTLLNFCQVNGEMIEFTVDRSTYKQGRFLPGTHIPVRSPDEIVAAKPDYVLILPWNLKSEILDQMSHIKSWGGQFVVPIPSVEVIQ